MKSGGRQKANRPAVKNAGDRFSHGQASNLPVKPRKKLIKLLYVGERRLLVSLKALRRLVIQQPLSVQLVDLGVREAAQRRAQHSYEGQLVVRVVYRPEQVNGVDDLLDGIEVSFALDHVMQASSAKRLQVVVDVRQLSQEYRHMLRLNHCLRSVFVDNLSLAQNIFLEPSRQTLCFKSPCRLGVVFFIFTSDFPNGHFAEGEGTLPVVGAFPRSRLDRDVIGLQPVPGLDQPIEDSVDDIQDLSMAEKIRAETAFDAVLRLDDFLHDFEIGLDVGAAESVNGLLRISDDEDLPRSELHLSPILGLPADLFGEIDQDFVLDRIGVLELVDQDCLVAALQRLANRGAIAQDRKSTRLNSSHNSI